MMNPFEANEYNRSMVIKNIGYLLRSFLQNPTYEYIIFNWAIHLEEIYEMILSELENTQFDLYKITLICNEDELSKRLQNDISKGKRAQNDIKKSIERIEMYKILNTIKIETTKKSIQEITAEVINIIQ